MSAEIEPKRDFYWLYVAGITLVLVAVITLVKLSENEKYDPIRQQQDEESQKMNIRILKAY